MRFLLALAICILTLAVAGVSAREMTGLRRLSGDAATSAPVSSMHSGAAATASASTKAQLPEITLYGEGLCPDTAVFVSKILGPLLDAGAIAKKGGSGSGKATTSSARAAAAATLDAASSPSSSSSSSLPLSSLPSGGFVSAHSGGPAPTALEQQPLALGGGGSAGTVTISSASSSSSFDDATTPAASFRFVAWGKAKRSADGKEVTCQHGPRECELNRLLGCAQAKEQQASGSSFPATLRCYFAALSKAGGGTPASLEKCVGDDALYSKISACASGPEGLALESAAGKETLEKQRELTFVPWVVVDGRQLAGECGSALKVACESSKAKGVSPLSPACSRVPELTAAGCPGAP